MARFPNQCYVKKKKRQVADNMKGMRSLAIGIIFRHSPLVIFIYVASLISRGCCNKAPLSGWLKQLKFIVSQFWGLEVRKQGVGRGMVPLTPVGDASSLPLPWCMFTDSSLCVCLCPNFPFGCGHQSYWFRAHPNDLLLTDYWCKDPITK